jgi:GDP-D-mannose dehydratase
MTSKKVLLTGISGWIAKHIAIELLNSGYEVLYMKKYAYLSGVISTGSLINKYVTFFCYTYFSKRRNYGSKRNS